jgi:DNA polymerase-3 subunit epsilon
MTTRQISTAIPRVDPHGFVVIDTETTGGHDDARVIELGMVFLSSTGRIQKSFCTLLYGGGTNGEWYARRAHRIRQDELKNAPRFREIAAGFLTAIEGRVVLAHNASFDQKRINYELALVRRNQIKAMACTIDLGRHLGHGRLSLQKAVDEFGLIRQVSHHALHDALATAQLFQRYLADEPRAVREYLKSRNLVD